VENVKKRSLLENSPLESLAQQMVYTVIVGHARKGWLAKPVALLLQGILLLMILPPTGTQAPECLRFAEVITSFLCELGDFSFAVYRSRLKVSISVKAY
jgi:hypothetical protein